ncbi:hypothetical protein RhiirA5_498422 [Rhizophagus irregularis]|uniref:Uncharacterized protein n=2 Tax=Rhizophagus irregularis TaxID=588596 RepID=U9TLE1_RHIID|nr:hypothetical protein GLOIN_2v1874274 [Rhizophagus irregularis DAOM 181602=DAOM 197198]PKC10479.1 hypothetical protein RhiirA5_498422 [Rhizophagus irregularis]PKC72529.1 hypothetical protein RhiirA1_411741 [Rhizophagus irregularis]PKK64756.1 hypothetical protein RhiirC2_854072 [Rhizophagus irregularis]PKY16014.1 hypothetical protein RhiirB3_520859 [Rhizophagus irregularis]PKY51524.1 hypothetical protein RhiirA4_546605 [Rhizophagus irregularis]|eukprot:XP_025180529.1 hypothetical protein GLOIN_2v1874274 [Rhizophagus irregularis DAOM 181602=DAOM 197198]
MSSDSAPPTPPPSPSQFNLMPSPPPSPLPPQSPPPSPPPSPRPLQYRYRSIPYSTPVVHRRAYRKIITRSSNRRIRI